MPIYTRTGDDGTTALYGGKRVMKSSDIVTAYGTVDELSSFIGMACSKIKDKKDRDLLIDIQKDLHLIMARLAGNNADLKFIDKKVKDFEEKIDSLDRNLTKLTKFIIPGGSEISSLLHITRVLARRSERKVVELTVAENKLIVKYLNRLSDLFFTLARHYNSDEEIFL